jgi:hypothetical protein
MAEDYELQFVADIIALLGKAKLVAGDANIERAAKLSDPETETTLRSRDNYRADTWLAINKLRMELEAGLPEAHALPLWRAAIEASNAWLSARRR